MLSVKRQRFECLDPHINTHHRARPQHPCFSVQRIMQRTCIRLKKQQQKPRTPVNMRAAHILATALVVANARPKWRADRAMLPALATLPRYPTNHTQTHTPQQHTHALASQIAEWPAGCPTQHATHARKTRHHAATTSLSTLQHSAAKIPRIFRPCAAPARQPSSSSSATAEVPRVVCYY